MAYKLAFCSKRLGGFTSKHSPISNAQKINYTNHTGVNSGLLQGFIGKAKTLLACKNFKFSWLIFLIYNTINILKDYINC